MVLVVVVLVMCMLLGVAFSIVAVVDCCYFYQLNSHTQKHASHQDHSK